MLPKFKFESVPEWVETKDGKRYFLKNPSKLLKLPTSFVDKWILNKSWYLVIGDWVIINCYGGIEQRCLEEVTQNE